MCPVKSGTRQVQCDRAFASKDCWQEEGPFVSWFCYGAGIGHEDILGINCSSQFFEHISLKLLRLAIFNICSSRICHLDSWKKQFSKVRSNFRLHTTWCNATLCLDPLETTSSFPYFKLLRQRVNKTENNGTAASQESVPSSSAGAWAIG